MAFETMEQMQLAAPEGASTQGLTFHDIVGGANSSLEVRSQVAALLPRPDERQAYIHIAEVAVTPVPTAPVTAAAAGMPAKARPAEAAPPMPISGPEDLPRSKDSPGSEDLPKFHIIEKTADNMV